MSSYAPFLYSLIQDHHALHGISHTRVPTESRPCHVSMFAGFYEDVSAIFTGWKDNPVEFDSVFNQSRYVLQIGSPDVVHIFRGKHISSFSYPPEMEDFSKESSLLDTWVFQKFQEELENIKKNMTIHKDRNIIFLHLLGMDSAGHSLKPPSPEYLNGIRVVDQGVEMVYKTIEKLFSDHKTSYIFTADHGMTDRGSHGDGDPQCTRTPFVFWGNGFRNSSTSNFTSDPLLEINQIDIPVLISSLLGLKLPKNNIGSLPSNVLEYSEAAHGQISDEDGFNETDILRVNALQIYAQLERWRQIKEEKMWIFHKPFPLQWNQSLLHTSVDYQKFIADSLEGMSYYQKYDHLFIATLVFIGFFCWIFLDPMQNVFSEKIFWKGSIFIFYASFIFMRGSSSTILQLILLIFAVNFIFHLRSFDLTPLQLFIFELNVFGYFRREIFSVIFLLLFQTATSAVKEPALILISVFTMLPLGVVNNYLILAGGLLFCCDILLSKEIKSSLITRFYFFLLILAIALVFMIDYGIQNKFSENFVSACSTLVWIVFAICLGVPFLVSCSLNQICLTFSIIYILLSVSYEVLFLFALIILLKRQFYQSKMNDTEHLPLNQLTLTYVFLLP